MIVRDSDDGPVLFQYSEILYFRPFVVDFAFFNKKIKNHYFSENAPFQGYKMSTILPYF